MTACRRRADCLLDYSHLSCLPCTRVHHTASHSTWTVDLLCTFYGRPVHLYTPHSAINPNTPTVGPHLARTLLPVPC